MTEIEEMLRESAEAVKRMAPEQLQAMREAQRRSWVIGETMLEHPGMTREEAERIYEKVSHDGD